VTSPDLTPSVAKLLAAKPDWVWPQWSNYTAAWKALRQAGYKGNIMMSGAAEDVPTYLQPGGSDANGVHLVVDFKSFDDTSDPEVKAYRDAMGSDPRARAEFTQNGFATVMTAATAMKQIKGEITGASLMDYLSKAQTLPIFMATTVNTADAPKAFPAMRAINAARIVQWKDDKIDPIAGPLKGAPAG